MKQYIFNTYVRLLKKLSGGYGIGKHPFFRPIFKKTYQHLKPDFIIIQNQKMFLDPKDSLQLSLNGVYSEFETEIVKNEIKPNDVVIDIGAHIGYFTLLFTMLVGPKGKVFSFEPEPKNFELLKKNIEINNHQNIISECRVVSDKNEKCILYTFTSSSGANRIYKPENNSEAKPIKSESISLDEYFKNSSYSKKIKFIKIDVEGAEFQALLGMKSIIQSNSKLKLFIEFNPSFLKQMGTEPKDLLDFLTKNNFTLFLIDSEKHCLIESTTDNILKSNLYKDQVVNLLCKKI